MTKPIVKVKGLKKNYGKVEALKGVGFEVKKGEVFTLKWSRKNYCSGNYRGFKEKR